MGRCKKMVARNLGSDRGRQRQVNTTTEEMQSSQEKTFFVQDDGDQPTGERGSPANKITAHQSARNQEKNRRNHTTSDTQGDFRGELTRVVKLSKILFYTNLRQQRHGRTVTVFDLVMRMRQVSVLEGLERV
eukprot:Lithocolla_globosa_v1_NODE_3516_length_1651_cov_2.508772.p3 type:complete len:132 gc:universal NODE_3516_length_1651_cov_2.508772:1133-1528(+)